MIVQQLVYANVEADQSPQRKRGNQTLYSSEPTLPDDERLFLEQRFGYPADTGPPRHLFCRTPRGRFVLAQAVPLAEPDRFGRLGRSLTHALLIDDKPFQREAGYDPFRVFDAVTFWATVEDARTLGQPDATGRLAPLEVTPTPTPETAGEPPVALAWWLLALRAEKLRKQRHAVGFVGSAETMRAMLRPFYSLLPPGVRPLLSFDTRAGDWRSREPTCWAVGVESAANHAGLYVCDRERQSFAPTLERPSGDREEWLAHIEVNGVPSSQWAEKLHDHSKVAKQLDLVGKSIALAGHALPPDALEWSLARLPADAITAHARLQLQQLHLADGLIERVLPQTVALVTGTPAQRWLALQTGPSLEQVSGWLVAQFDDSTAALDKADERDLLAFLGQHPQFMQACIPLAKLYSIVAVRRGKWQLMRTCARLPPGVKAWFLGEYAAEACRQRIVDLLAQMIPVAALRDRLIARLGTLHDDDDTTWTVLADGWSVEVLMEHLVTLLGGAAAADAWCLSVTDDAALAEMLPTDEAIADAGTLKLRLLRLVSAGSWFDLGSAEPLERALHAQPDVAGWLLDWARLPLKTYLRHTLSRRLGVDAVVPPLMPKVVAWLHDSPAEHVRYIGDGVPLTELLGCLLDSLSEATGVGLKLPDVRHLLGLFAAVAETQPGGMPALERALLRHHAEVCRFVDALHIGNIPQMASSFRKLGLAQPPGMPMYDSELRFHVDHDHFEFRFVTAMYGDDVGLSAALWWPILDALVNSPELAVWPTVSWWWLLLQLGDTTAADHERYPLPTLHVLPGLSVSVQRKPQVTSDAIEFRYRPLHLPNRVKNLRNLERHTRQEAAKSGSASTTLNPKEFAFRDISWIAGIHALLRAELRLSASGSNAT